MLARRLYCCRAHFAFCVMKLVHKHKSKLLMNIARITSFIINTLSILWEIFHSGSLIIYCYCGADIQLWHTTRKIYGLHMLTDRQNERNLRGCIKLIKIYLWTVYTTIRNNINWMPTSPDLSYLKTKFQRKINHFADIRYIPIIYLIHNI